MVGKPKAIIFGAGGGGQKFVQNSNDEYNFIAFTDNDKKKHGNDIKGVPIISPSKILNEDFDVIIIASMWVKEIMDQLIDLGINKDKLHVPPKNKLKNGTPFVDENTKNFGREMIFWLTDLFEKYDVDLYVDFGTLLGFVRDGDILDWDDDIDLSVNESNFPKVLKIMEDISNQIPSSNKVQWTGSLLYDNDDNKYGVNLDCLPLENSPINRFDIFIRNRIQKNGYSIPMGALSYLYIPKIHFTGFDKIDVYKNQLKAPNNHEKYLDIVYGDWKVPKKGIGFSDYPAIDMSVFGKTDDSPMKNKLIF